MIEFGAACPSRPNSANLKDQASMGEPATKQAAAIPRPLGIEKQPRSQRFAPDGLLAPSSFASGLAAQI